MKGITSDKRAPVAMALCMLLIWAGSLVRGQATAGSDPQASEITTEMQGLPPLTAQGGSIALHWTVGGGYQVDRTRVCWDVTSHAYDNAYTYATLFQERKPMGHFFDYIDVPEGAQTIYLKPYAVVDGEAVWGREYHVWTRLAINVGSASSAIDSQGNGWAADRDFEHHWYGFGGGNPHTVEAPIAGTVDDFIYQTQRRGVDSFGCWLSAGSAWTEIEAEFHFAELGVTGPGERVFDIVLEKDTPNEVKIRNIDVAGQVGSYHSLVLTKAVTVQDDQLDIEFLPRSGEPPILNGLVLWGVNGVPERQASQRIAAFDDDTYVNGAANHRRDETIFLDGNGQNHGGLRFIYLQIPQGATINHAELRVTVAEESYQEMKLRIYAHDVDHSDDFSRPPLVPDRPRTGHFVAWNVPRSEGWQAGREYAPPELREIIQDVVDRPGWRWGNALSLLLIANGGDLAARRVWAKDGSDHDRAWLIVDYTPGYVWPPTPAPTLTFTPIPSETQIPTRTSTPTQTATPSSTPTRTDTPTLTSTPTSTVTATPHSLHLPMLLKPYIKG